LLLGEPAWKRERLRSNLLRENGPRQRQEVELVVFRREMPLQSPPTLEPVGQDRARLSSFIPVLRTSPSLAD